MKKRTKKIEIRIDNIPVGTVRVAWNATEKMKVRAACSLPGVRQKLMTRGVLATEKTPLTYNIKTRIPASQRPPMEVDQSRKYIRNPFSGSGVRTRTARL